MSMLLGTLSAVFWGVLLLSILVFVHEGGHYLAARAFGVRVTEFYLGLPCRFKLFYKSKKRGTEVGVTPLLLGGYNRICGMEGEADELMAPAFAIVQREGRVEVEAVARELNVDMERAYALMVGLADLAAIRPYYNPELGEKPYQRDYPAAFETVARDATMLTEYDAGHDFNTPQSTGDGEARPLDDAEAQLAAEVSHTYRGVSVPKRLVMLIAGPFVNLLLAFVLTTGVIMATEYSIPKNTNVLGGVTESSIAQAAGLSAGDQIVRVGDAEVTDWLTLRDQLSAACKKGTDFTVTYVRDGKESTTTLDLPEGQAVEAIGVTCAMEAYHPTLFEAMQMSLRYAGMVGEAVTKLIMPQHTMEVLDQSSSIVGISVKASEAAAAGIVELVSLMAAISMSLGFMNLLPIPPLDGGKILVELIQVLIRRPLSMKAQMAISYVGIAFFVFVFVMVVKNDVVHILGF